LEWNSTQDKKKKNIKSINKNFLLNLKLENTITSLLLIKSTFFRKAHCHIFAYDVRGGRSGLWIELIILYNPLFFGY
ncbi:MAG: hypothetical protein SOR65_00700, partial [Odoribacter sp.]|nr:hypothetical protein [Odoribacter sp.]